MPKEKPRYPYTTHTGLVLDVTPDGDNWVVTLKGDNIKELAECKSKAEAEREADKVREHYEQRCEDEA